jgi:hypothetical protein
VSKERDDMVDSVQCHIRVKGHLPSRWTVWFGGLEIENQPEGEAVLSGTLSDQAALHGVLKRVRDLGLSLVSVKCIECAPGEKAIPRSLAGDVDQKTVEVEDVQEEPAS